MHKAVVTCSVVLVTELETGAVLAVAIAKKMQKNRGREHEHQLDFFWGFNRHPFSCVMFVDGCGEDNGKLLASVKPSLNRKGVSLSRTLITCF